MYYMFGVGVRGSYFIGENALAGISSRKSVAKSFPEDLNASVRPPSRAWGAPGDAGGAGLGTGSHRDFWGALHYKLTYPYLAFFT